MDLGNPAHRRQDFGALVSCLQSGSRTNLAWTRREPGLGFSPGVKVSYDFTPKISGGVEYYADYGRLGAFDTLHEQQQQIFAVTDLNVSPKWRSTSEWVSARQPRLTT